MKTRLNTVKTPPAVSGTSVKTSWIGMSARMCAVMAGLVLGGELAAQTQISFDEDKPSSNVLLQNSTEPTGNYAVVHYMNGGFRNAGFSFIAPSNAQLQAFSLIVETISAHAFDTQIEVRVVEQGPNLDYPELPLEVIYTEVFVTPAADNGYKNAVFTFTTPVDLEEDKSYGILLNFLGPTPATNKSIGWQLGTLAQQGPDVGRTFGSFSYDWSEPHLTGGQAFQFTLVSVPEPSTYALIAGAMAVACVFVVRNRKNS